MSEENGVVVEKKEKQSDMLKALGFEELLAKKISTVKELRKAVKIIKELPEDVDLAKKVEITKLNKNLEKIIELSASLALIDKVIQEKGY